MALIRRKGVELEQLTAEQSRFVEMVKRFYFDHEPRRDYLTLQGNPGTGKTYIVSKIQEILGLSDDECVYVVRTGKAATVLQSKGVPAITIHRLIYDLVDGKKLVFTRKPSLEKNYKLIIVDEFSTVDAKMMNDLLSYGVPLIIVGDAHQLPPIGVETDYLSHPDFILTEILRQKKDSLIVKLAQGILRGKVPRYGQWGSPGNSVRVVPRDALTFSDLQSVEQVICGTNETRATVNQLFRRQLHHFDYLPENGERVIITKNMWNYVVDGLPIINGTTGVIQKPMDKGDYLLALFRPDYTGEGKALRIDKNPFVGKSPKADRDLATCDFGYCITVHKAQGSEYDSVLFIADKMPERINIRFLNTGITRARKDLVLAI